MSTQPVRSRPSRVSVVAAVLGLALVACGESGCEQPSAAAPSASTNPNPDASSGPSGPLPESSSRTGPPAVAPSGPAAGDRTLAFAGDVHFTGRTLSLLDAPQTAIGPFAGVLRSADFAMVNLETAVTGRGTPQPKRYHFRTPTSAYAAIKAAGIDAVSIANNHSLDYGQIGLTDTLNSAGRAQVPVVGAGRTAAEAYRPYLTTVGGLRLAVVAFSQVHELASTWQATDSRPGIAMAFNTARATAAVRAAGAQADVVIVFMHWGVEGSPCPSTEMKKFAGKMADAGADIVLGTHAHTLLADGWIGDTYVHYGLGNFLWYSNSLSTNTGVLRLTLRRQAVVRAEFLPGVVSATGQPEPATGAARQRVEHALARAAACNGLARHRS